jgi:soluble lytic murein transglycosylase-like protein
LRLALLLPLLAATSGALAGAQQYEPLADSVRTRLSRLVADRAVPSMTFRSSTDAQRWLAEMDGRLARRMPDRKQRLELLRTVHYEATRARLDPQLVLGVIEVESGFRKYAVSRAGARGYMQVMPFWVKLIGQPGHNLFHLRTNLAYGCAILRFYLDVEHGDYFRALGRYNGSLGQPEYPGLVLSAWRGRWKYDGPTA